MTMTGLWKAFNALPRWVHLALGVAAMIGAALCWINMHDAAVIDGHEAGVSAQVSETVTRADRAAIAADETRAEQRAADSAETKGAIADAQAKHPDEVRRPAGPAVQSAADSLRNRAGQDRRATP